MEIFIVIWHRDNGASDPWPVGKRPDLDEIAREAGYKSLEDFEDATFGQHLEVQGPYWVDCPSCGGSPWPGDASASFIEQQIEGGDR